ncbi:GDSL esterase/lipase [Rhynchospora pubera]|uniref:GDSL esterase/lipase n=1 Tax=Rhynchospora pubera TaxID=906938 RepID=A0AAV8BYE8_9POAL|nr:GDSL esterase/lipase [Rhynchospora pubera]
MKSEDNIHLPPLFPLNTLCASLFSKSFLSTSVTIMPTNMHFLLPFLIFFLSVSQLCKSQLVPGTNMSSLLATGVSTNEREMVPAMFAFGDSLIDDGNNNDLPSFAKANYYPYGIDFSGGPTGRFSNGYTIVDEIADLLGLPLIPPNSQASGEAALHGVNYASAAAGILDVTGQNFVSRIPFDKQIQNFENTLDQVTDNLGADGVADALAQCLFFVGMGSNDYLNNYLMPNYNTRSQYNPQQFSDLLVQQYKRQLMSLYNLGARKFIIAGIGSMSCIPNMRAQNFQSQCSPTVDRDLIIPFNYKLKIMLNTLNRNLPKAKFIYMDIYKMISDILAKPRSYGFQVIDRGCCGIGRNRGQITCLPFQTPCVNRNEYVFWDAFHPTAAVNILLARKAFYGNTDVVFPMNIYQLAQLNLEPS